MPDTDIILRFLLDQAAQSQTKAGVSGLTGDMKKLDESLSGEKLTTELEKTIKKLKKTEQVTKETIAGLKAEARVLSATANAMLDGAEKRSLAFTKSLSSQLQGISKLSLATGTALVGGILGFANKYVNNAKEATAVTIAWKREQDSLNKSGTRFGAVLSQEALPLLREGARLAEGVASFVETHPEAVRAALNTGKVLIALGSIGLLVSKGIKLYADIKYLATIPIELQAAKLRDQAANKELEAALIRAKTAGVSVPNTPGVGGAAATGGLAAAATSVGLVVAGVIAAKYAVDLVNIVLQKTGIAKSIADAQQKILETSKRPYPGIITAARPGATAGTAAITTPELTGAAASTQFDAVLQAYEQYKQDDLSAVQKHYADRKKIMADALASEQKSNAQYAANVAKLRSQSASALSSASKDLQATNEKAEIDYQTNRAQIVRDGNQEIEQLQQDLQERLRKNQEEHEDRVFDLTNSRDALGLAKERDSFKDEQSEAKREAKQEINQRRADIAQRLSDLAQSYEQERAQRFADHEARVAEIRAQAAQQLTELRLRHAAELREIQQAKIDRIKQLDDGYIEERKRRYQQLIQSIRDLDAALLGERSMKLQNQAAELADLEKFLAAERAKKASILAAAVPGKADGGYTAGLVRTGERGVEWIASHNTTRAAEAMIGERLTQEGLLSALAGAGSKQSVTWNDQRRFDGSYTNEIRRANRKDTLELLGGLFN